MQELGYLDDELERWFTSYNKLYVHLVERHLAEAFTSYRPGQENSFVRRSAPKLACAYVFAFSCFCYVNN